MFRRKLRRGKKVLLENYIANTLTIEYYKDQQSKRKTIKRNLQHIHKISTHQNFWIMYFKTGKL